MIWLNEKTGKKIYTEGMISAPGWVLQKQDPTPAEKPEEKKKPARRKKKEE